MIFAAQPEQLPQVWPYALPHLERFSRETKLVSAEDMYRDIQAKEKQLWMVHQNDEVTAAIVTQIYGTMQGNICCVWAACGNSGIPALKDALSEIERWAKDIGCIIIEIRGRRGWKRALPEFKESGVLLEKQINLH